MKDLARSPTSPPDAPLQDNEVLLSEALALVRPQEKTDWELKYRENEKLLRESEKEQQHMKRELKALRNKIPVLEHQNKVYDDIFDRFADKRVEDKARVAEWHRKCEAMIEQWSWISKQLEGSEFEGMFQMPIANESEEAPAPKRYNEGRMRKRPKLELEENTMIRYVSPGSNNIPDITQDSDALPLFKGIRHASEEPTPHEFAKPNDLPEFPLRPPRVEDTPSEKQASLDMEARGIPNLVSSPTFSSSQSFTDLKTRVRSETDEDVTFIKDEMLEDAGFEVLDINPVNAKSANELASEFDVSDGSFPPTRKSNPDLEISLPSVYIPSAQANERSGPSSDDVTCSSPALEMPDVVLDTEAEIHPILETPKSMKRRSSKFHGVSFSEIDHELRMRQHNHLESLNFAGGDADSDSNRRVVLGTRGRNNKRKNVLIHVPSPQSVVSDSKSESNPGGIVVKKEDTEGGAGKGYSSTLMNWLKGGTKISDTPTRKSNSSTGLLRAKKATLSERMRQYGTKAEKIEL